MLSNDVFDPFLHVSILDKQCGVLMISKNGTTKGMLLVPPGAAGVVLSRERSWLLHQATTQLQTVSLTVAPRPLAQVIEKQLNGGQNERKPNHYHFFPRTVHNECANAT